MIKAFTSMEQSTALLVAGLPIESADCCYVNTGECIKPMLSLYIAGRYTDNNAIPAWSTARLMALLPDDIVLNRGSSRRRHYTFEIMKLEPWQYLVYYYRTNHITGELDVLHESSSIDSPTDALVDVLLWVLENHYEDKDVIMEICNEKETAI